MTGDRDGDVDRVDRHRAVDHVEQHRGEVGVLVLKLIRRKPHVGRAGVGTANVRCAAEGEVRLGVQRVAEGDVIAGDRVDFAVVVDRFGVTGDDDGRVDRVDRHVAVGHVEGDGSEVRVQVFKLIGRKSHVGGADVGGLGGIIPAKGEVGFGVQVVAERYVIPADAVRLAVKVGFRRMTGHGNGHVDRYDRHVAVGHVKCDGGKVFALIRKLT